jgi:hypothetical protein
MKNRKAQTSRTDLAVWYGVFLMAVIVLVGTMYGFGIIGVEDTRGSLIESNMITGAFIANTSVSEAPAANDSASANISETGDENNIRNVDE